jgi:Cyclin, N-terminal domain
MYDCGSKNNSDQTMDSIEAMRFQESSAYLVHDYFAQLELRQRRNIRKRPESPADVREVPPPPVDASCRYLMAKWCHSLCDFCNYPRDLTASAMSCVDRFVATGDGLDVLLDRDRYQLAVMTAFYMMAKIHQMEALDPRSVANLSRGKHSKDSIEEMEMKMLVALRWRVNPPTAASFAHELLNLIPPSSMDESSRKRIADLTKLQIDLAVCDYDLSLNLPSQIALGCLLNAMESLDTDFAMQFEAMVSTHVLKPSHSSVGQLREIRIGLLGAVSDDPCAAHPMGSLLTRKVARGAVPLGGPVGQHLGSSSACVNTSPRCVTLTIAQ